MLEAWSTVIGPLARASVGELLCAGQETAMATRMLANSTRRVHLLAGREQSSALAVAYPERVVLHDGPAAWSEIGTVGLVVLDARIDAEEHVARIVEAGERAAAAAVVVHGGDASWIPAPGWDRHDLPGDGAAVFLGPHAGWAREVLGMSPPQSAVEPEDELQALRRRIVELEAERVEAEQRTRSAEEVGATLRMFYAEASAAQRRAEAEVNALRGEVSALREAARRAEDVAPLQARLAALDARRKRLETEHDAVLADLRRISASHAWRCGHGLSRLLRVLTFRRPGRTDGISKAIGRLESARRNES